MLACHADRRQIAPAVAAAVAVAACSAVVAAAVKEGNPPTTRFAAAAGGDVGCLLTALTALGTFHCFASAAAFVVGGARAAAFVVDAFVVAVVVAAAADYSHLTTAFGVADAAAAAEGTAAAMQLSVGSVGVEIVATDSRQKTCADGDTAVFAADAGALRRAP